MKTFNAHNNRGMWSLGDKYVSPKKWRKQQNEQLGGGDILWYQKFSLYQHEIIRNEKITLEYFCNYNLYLSDFDFCRERYFL